jgi:hypothetical protein
MKLEYSKQEKDGEEVTKYLKVEKIGFSECPFSGLRMKTDFQFCQRRQILGNSCNFHTK